MPESTAGATRRSLAGLAEGASRRRHVASSPPNIRRRSSSTPCRAPEYRSPHGWMAAPRLRARPPHVIAEAAHECGWDRRRVEPLVTTGGHRLRTHDATNGLLTRASSPLGSHGVDHSTPTPQRAHSRSNLSINFAVDFIVSSIMASQHAQCEIGARVRSKRRDEMMRSASLRGGGSGTQRPERGADRRAAPTVSIANSNPNRAPSTFPPRASRYATTRVPRTS